MTTDPIDTDAVRARIAAAKPSATVWNCTQGCWATGNHEDGCAPVPDDLDIVKAEASALADEIDRLSGLLRDANEAFDDCTGPYQKELVEGEPWRAYRDPDAEDGHG